MQRNTVLKPDQNCATITINVNDFTALIHRIQSQEQRLDRLEKFIISSRREALRMELAALEDGQQLQRTYEKRVR